MTKLAEHTFRRDDCASKQAGKDFYFIKERLSWM